MARHLAPSPDALLAEPLAAAVGADLDRQIERQSEAGGWEPEWQWDDRWPEVWAQARVEWCGELTLRTLRALNAWGRFEG